LLLEQLADAGKDADIVAYPFLIVLDRGERQPLGLQFAVFSTIPNLAPPMAFIGNLAPDSRRQLFVVQSGVEGFQIHTDDGILLNPDQPAKRGIRIDDLESASVILKKSVEACGNRSW
jgi:hypothetical protein